METGSRSDNIRFSEPRVPIVFILGGPGSGKITHCDRAVQERQGLAHVNMTDLIQQHIVGNGNKEIHYSTALSLTFTACFQCTSMHILKLHYIFNCSWPPQLPVAFNNNFLIYISIH